mmetsp:Transcript_20244/g.32997  ORF Transcript_20244/g.32997 Transcript_20244/m.32997 type:complete len:138 (+) Transcript_20244:1245-1658(+)
MCDPAAVGDYDSDYDGDYDYYPDRYTGTYDNGGVHWNSGIANLAACLMVKGGTHPRGKTSTVVKPLFDIASSDDTFDELGRIWYEANTMCLTPSSDSASATCMAEITKKTFTKHGMPSEFPTVHIPHHMRQLNSRVP